MAAATTGRNRPNTRWAACGNTPNAKAKGKIPCGTNAYMSRSCLTSIGGEGWLLLSPLWLSCEAERRRRCVGWSRMTSMAMNRIHDSQILHLRTPIHSPKAGDRCGPAIAKTVPSTTRAANFFRRPLSCSDRTLRYAHRHSTGTHATDPTMNRLLAATTSLSIADIASDGHRMIAWQSDGCNGYSVHG